MAELTIDLTYATALYEAAKETGKVDTITEEASQVLDIFKQEPDLDAFVKYPGISAGEKKSVLENIFDGRIYDELLNFLCILIDKGRIIHFERIVKTYSKMVEREEGFSYGTVYSVVPLSEDRIAELEAESSKLFRINVKLSNEIDPDLIGGIKLMVEGKLLDASVRKKFDDLGSQINSN